MSIRVRENSKRDSSLPKHRYIFDRRPSVIAEVEAASHKRKIETGSRVLGYRPEISLVGRGQALDWERAWRSIVARPKAQDPSQDIQEILCSMWDNDELKAGLK